MLNKIKLLLNISSTDKDELLALLIANAIEYAEGYMHRTDAVDVVSKAIIEMVIFDYNRIGTEGLTSESLGGVSFNYSPSYPDNILNQLKAYRKIRVI